MSSKDRRRESRIPYRSVVDLRFPSEELQHRETRDISVTGTFVEGVSGQKRGETCDIKLVLTGESSELLLKLQGEVVRVEKEGVGIEFIDVKRDCFYHLKNIAYVIHSNPDDIICTNYKKPRKSKIVISEDAGYEDEDYEGDDDDNY